MMPNLTALLMTLAAAHALTAGPVTDPTPRRDVTWHQGDFASALRTAREEKKPVLIQFRADWCKWCKQHVAKNLEERRVQDLMKGFVCFDADLSEDESGAIVDEGAEALMNRFGVRRFPSLIVVRGDDRPEDLISGFLPAKRLEAELARIASGKDTLTDLARRVEAANGDLELRYRYALKLDELGDADGYRAQIARIVALDPKSRSLPRQRMALDRLREELWGCMRDPEKEPDLTELRALVASTRYPEIRCNGWLLVGVVQTELGQKEAARTAYRKAWSCTPDDMIASTGNGIAWAAWTDRDDLTAADKQWALEVAEAVVATLEDEPVDPLTTASYLDTLACCCYMNGHRNRAQWLLRRCVELDPDEPAYKERIEQFR